MILCRKVVVPLVVCTAAMLGAPRAFGQAAPLVEDPNAVVTSAPAGANAWTRDTPELVAAALQGIPDPPPGPFKETWDSIKQNYQDPEWFRDAKFGIYMHWGIYSVPAHGSEWYVRYMYGGNAGIMQWHTEHFGDPHRHLRSFRLPFCLYSRSARQRRIRSQVGRILQRCRPQQCRPCQVHARLGRQAH